MSTKQKNYFFTLCFWLLLALPGFFIAVANALAASDEVNCDPSLDQEYTLTIQKLASDFALIRPKLEEYVLTRDKAVSNDPYLTEYQNNFYSKFGYPNHYSTKYDLYAKKTPYVFVYVHGLYGNPRQFQEFGDNVAYKNNQIFVTLPGHGMDTPNADKITYQDWIHSVEKELRIAKKLGEKVILVGQSTGGMLGIIMGIEHPDLVDQLILIEPAIKVQSKIEFATCAGKYLVKDVRSVGAIAALVGAENPAGRLDPYSTSLACEVSKLRPYLVNKYLENDPTKGAKEILEDSTALGKLVKVPTLVVNNKKDTVVDADHVEAFVEGVSTNAQTERRKISGTHGFDTAGTLKALVQSDNFFHSSPWKKELQAASTEKHLYDSIVFHKDRVRSTITASQLLKTPLEMLLFIRIWKGSYASPERLATPLFNQLCMEGFLKDCASIRLAENPALWEEMETLVKEITPYIQNWYFLSPEEMRPLYDNNLELHKKLDRFYFLVKKAEALYPQIVAALSAAEEKLAPVARPPKIHWEGRSRN